MAFTIAEIEEQLTSLLRAMVNEPRWSQSSLHTLPVVERQFMVSRQVGIRATQANLNLALCLLQATNRLVPAIPLGNVRSWKMMIGAEMNCLAAVRGYVASTLLKEVPDSVRGVLRECAKQTALPAAELVGAEPRALKEVVRRTVTALWLWKTGEPPALAASADWRDLIDRLSGTQVWTRDVIYAQREKFIKELAKYLASEEASSQLPGLGPQVFEAADPPTTRPLIADEPTVAALTAEETKSATPIEEPLNATKAPAINTIELYLDRALPAAPQYVPIEWRELIEAAAAMPQVFIQGEAGSGKTHVLYAIGQTLKQAGQVPLYVRVSAYAPYARDLDIFQFVATRGGFGQLNRDENLRRDFESALVEAQQAGRLIVLADQCDDLFESEIAEVAQRLRGFQRVLIAERSANLPLARSNETTLRMPYLSTDSIVRLTTAVQTAPNDFHRIITDLSQQPMTVTPSLASVAARSILDTGDWHPITFIGRWIDQALSETRTLGPIVAEIDKARDLLRNLAAVRTGVSTYADPMVGLSRDDIGHAIRELRLSDQEDIARQLVDRLERSGFLSRTGDQWTFANAIFERFLAVEYAATHNLFWIALHPLHHAMVCWLAAYLARRGSEQLVNQFLDHLRKAVASATTLSILEVAEYLVEFHAVGRAIDPQFMDATIGILRDLAEVESSRVRSEVAQRAARLKIDLQVPRTGSDTFAVMLPADLAHLVRSLSGLLREIGVQPPKGGEHDWLEDRGVMNELIHALAKTQSFDLKMQCAAWLQQSSLSKVISVVIDTQVVWRSRARPALEVLAELARAADTDIQTAFAARSVLCKDEFIVRLWQRGDEYRALVFDLLLAQNKRLAAAALSPNERKWQVIG